MLQDKATLSLRPYFGISTSDFHVPIFPATDNKVANRFPSSTTRIENKKDAPLYLLTKQIEKSLQTFIS